MKENITIAQNSFSFTITQADASQRLDTFLSQKFAAYSRSFLQRLIQERHVFVNSMPAPKASWILKLHDVVTVNFPTSKESEKPKALDPDIKIDIIFEHEHFFVINKPAGLMVHTPNHASETATLVDWITLHHQDIAHTGQADRPGIIHRLDKDTSGVLIIGRTNYAHNTFGALFEQRTIHKTYLAIVHGHTPKTGTIDLAIGRSPNIRTKMMAVPAGQTAHTKIRHALTHYTTMQYFNEYSLVEVKPVTGRTHQIRVHMAAIGHPIVGDIVYGKSSPLINRQALHAFSLEFTFDGKKHELTANIPEDIEFLLQQLGTSTD